MRRYTYNYGIYRRRPPTKQHRRLLPTVTHVPPAGELRDTGALLDTLETVPVDLRTSQAILDPLLRVPVDLRDTQALLEVLCSPAQASDEVTFPPGGTTTIGIIWVEAYLPE